MQSNRAGVLTDIVRAYMNSILFFGVGRVAALWLLLVGLGYPAWAGSEIKVEAQLIWGTNQDRPEKQDMRELEGKLKEKLGGVFKWKNYFEIEKQEFSVPEQGTKNVRMSPKCRIEVQGLGKGWVEVKLFGKKTSDSKEELVVKKKQLLKPGEILALAGDDINDSAWFVILKTP